MTKLKLKDITVNPQPRKNFDSVDMLSESIAKVGQLFPVLVRKSADKLVLIDGECRMRAIQKLGREEIDAIIVSGERELTETDHKEMQMTANLCRADLSLIERMRGFAALLVNAPAKYNTLVVARRFGYKEKEIEKLIKVANKIVPAVDEQLGSGRFEWEEFETLSTIPAEFQEQVVKKAMRENNSIPQSLYALTEEVWFDDVFTLEKARATGKLHFKTQWADRWRTFDKAFAVKTKEDYEARSKKKYADESAKAKKGQEEQKELTAEQKKKAAAKEKERKAKVLSDLKNAVTKFIHTPRGEKEREVIVESQLQKLGAESLKCLLQAFAVEFKASDCSTADLRVKVFKLFKEQKFLLPERVLSIVTLVDLRAYGGAEEWLKAIKKEM